MNKEEMEEETDVAVPIACAGRKRRDNDGRQKKRLWNPRVPGNMLLRSRLEETRAQPGEARRWRHNVNREARL